MGEIRGYKDLIAWQKAMDLVVLVYRLTASFPREERFGLTAQARKAVISVPSNIAEGYGRSSKRDYMRFLEIARGSANELETELLAAKLLKMGTASEFPPVFDLTNEVQRVVSGLILSLDRSPSKRLTRASEQVPRQAKQLDA
ncbi:MAG TPA: four helix bundle protein [Phycisphaerae bacterium]|nr:four helix bundle protein [Phycisphaerae bacterium]